MEQTKTALHLSDLSLPELDQVLQKYPWFSLARKEFFLRMTSLGEDYKNEGLKKAAVYVFSREGLLKEGQKIKAMVQEKESENKAVEIDLNMLDEDYDIQEKEKEFTLEPVEIEIEEEAVKEPAKKPEEEPAIELEEAFDEPREETREKEIKKEEVQAEETPKKEVPKEDVVRKEPKKEIHIVGGDYFGREDLDSLKEDGLTTIERFHTISRAPEISVSEENLNGDDFTDEEYYTETLAKVYANQGYYQKASNVYEKLILLYPEKSTYFAALKEDIKKYL